MKRSLRRDIRLLQLWAIVSSGIVVVLAAAGFTQGQARGTRFEEISVERINIIEQDGRVRLVLANGSRQADGVLYSTSTLAEDLEVTGPISAILYVATSAPSADFTAKLVDVHPDGIAYNVSDGIIRRAYGPNSESSFQWCHGLDEGDVT